jgi:hypothetical protein
MKAYTVYPAMTVLVYKMFCDCYCSFIQKTSESQHDSKRENLDGITTVTLVHVISKQTVNMNLIMIFRPLLFFSSIME